MADTGVPPDSKLTQQQKEKIVDWINQKATAHQVGICPICSHRQWAIGDDLITGTPFRGGALFVGGQQYVFATIICTNCSNTQFLNAVVMGLLPPSKKEGET